METLIADRRFQTGSTIPEPDEGTAPAATGLELLRHSERLKQAQARLLMDGTQLAALLSLLAAPLVAYLLIASIGRQPALVWCGAVAGIAILRLGSLVRHRRRSRAGRTDLHRIRISLLVWNGLSGLAWGSAAFLVYPPDSLPQQILLLLVLAGAVAVAVTVHSGMLNAVLVFSVPAIVPMIVRLFSENSTTHHQLALLAGLFLFAILLIAHKMQRLTFQGIRVGVYNTDLVDHLREAKQETDHLNQKLRREVAIRRNTEARLRQERDFISGVLDTENAIVMVMDLDGVILRFNRAGEAATGFQAHELIGKPLWQTLLPEDQTERFRQDFSAVVQGNFPRETEVQWNARDGERRLLQLSTTAILGDSGRCSHVVSTGIDITAQRQVQQALAFTQENFRFLVEGVTDYAIFMLDRDGSIVSWNPGAEHISGHSETDVIGRHFGQILQPEEQAGLQPDTMLRIAGTDGYYQREGWFLRSDGSRFWAILAINPIRDGDRKLRGYSIIINDISERKQAETELARSRESLQALSRHLQTVREEEKANLARELHDELGSLLTSLKIELSALQQQASDAEQVRTDIDRINDRVQDAIATTRRISTSLRPPILDNLGLLPAVEWQLEQFGQRTGIEYDLHCDGDAAGLSQDQTIALFRILQEGLTNITRHAGAGRVSVALIINAQQAALDVIDDGIGFDFEEKSSAGSYGLYSMQERARALGGSLNIMSRTGEGTRLRVRIPVARRATQQQEEPTA